MSKRFSMTYGGAALTVVIAIVLAVVATMAITVWNKQPEKTLPAGCAPDDRDLPGCRPSSTGTNPNTVAVATVIVTPLAALAAALLAAGAASRRQRDSLKEERDRLKTQLDEESKRLQRQLDAESERLDTQLKAEATAQAARLAHEQSMRHADDRRRALIEATNALTLVTDACLDIEVAGERYVEVQDDEAARPARLARYLETRVALEEQLTPLYRRVIEVMALFGRTSEVVERLSDAYKKLNETYVVSKSTPSAENNELVGKTRASASPEIDAFFDAVKDILDKQPGA